MTSSRPRPASWSSATDTAIQRHEITATQHQSPQIRLYAGALLETRSPSCVCNACDENWIESSTELERQTLAIASGGFTEEVSEPRRPEWSFDWGHGFTQGMGQTVTYRLRALDGSIEMSGASRAENLPVAVLEQAQTTLQEAARVSPEGNWKPWSLRKIEL